MNDGAVKTFRLEFVVVPALVLALLLSLLFL